MLRDEPIDVIYEQIHLDWKEINRDYCFERPSNGTGICNKYKVEYIYSTYSNVLWDFIIDGYTEKNLVFVKNGESYRLAAEAFKYDHAIDNEGIDIMTIKPICCFDIAELDRGIGIRFKDCYKDNIMRFVYDREMGIYESVSGEHKIVFQNIGLAIHNEELVLNLKFDIVEDEEFLEGNSYSSEKNLKTLYHYFYYKSMAWYDAPHFDVLENDDELPF